jgi:DNA-binding NarL/FixJ family response regulator
LPSGTAANSNRSAAGEEASIGSTKPKRPRVVIAEDFALIQENIRRALPPDCEVIAAVEDGASALDAVAALHPDILLLDVSLPDMSGIRVAEKLFGANSPVKVVFLTAYADRSYVERAFEIGVKGYLLKGKMWTELPEAICEVLAGGVYRSPPSALRAPTHSRLRYEVSLCERLQRAPATAASSWTRENGFPR